MGVGDRTCRALWAIRECLAEGRARGGTEDIPGKDKTAGQSTQGRQHTARCARDCQIQPRGCEQPSEKCAFSLFLKVSRGRETEWGRYDEAWNERKEILHVTEAKSTGHRDWWRVGAGRGTSRPSLTDTLGPQRGSSLQFSQDQPGQLEIQPGETARPRTWLWGPTAHRKD